MKSSEVSIKTRSTPASLTIQGQVTKDTTVKWSIIPSNLHYVHVLHSDYTSACFKINWRRRVRSKNLRVTVRCISGDSAATIKL